MWLGAIYGSWSCAWCFLLPFILFFTLLPTTEPAAAAAGVGNAAGEGTRDCLLLEPINNFDLVAGEAVEPVSVHMIDKVDLCDFFSCVRLYLS